MICDTRPMKRRNRKTDQERLEEFLNNLPDDEGGNISDQSSFPSGLRFFSAAQFMNIKLSPRRKLLPWLSEKDIVFVYAWREVGKTWWALRLAIALANGGTFCKHKVAVPTKCFYFEGEMPYQEIQKRLRWLHRMTPFDEDMLQIRPEDFYRSIGEADINLKNQACRELIEDTLVKGSFRAVVFDNLSTLTCGLDENSSFDWRPILSWFSQLRSQNIMVIFIHHEGKKSKPRGTSAFEDIADISIRLSNPTGIQVSGKVPIKTTFKKSRNVPGLKGKSFVYDFYHPDYLTTRTTKKKKSATVNAAGGKGVKLSDKYIRILKWLIKDRNIKQVQISEKTGYSQKDISNAKKKAVEMGLITEDRKLKKAGKRLLESQ